MGIVLINGDQLTPPDDPSRRWLQDRETLYIKKVDEEVFRIDS